VYWQTGANEKAATDCTDFTERRRSGAAPVWGVGLRGLRVCAGFIRASIREIRAIRGCFIFCGFLNATEFLMSMNDTPPQELCVSVFPVVFL